VDVDRDSAVDGGGDISLPVAGMVELRMMIFDVIPPIVSMPSEAG
jgi:hypothetical protein